MSGYNIEIFFINNLWTNMTLANVWSEGFREIKERKWKQNTSDKLDKENQVGKTTKKRIRLHALYLYIVFTDD